MPRKPRNDDDDFLKDKNEPTIEGPPTSRRIKSTRGNQLPMPVLLPAPSVQSRDSKLATFKK